MTALSSFRRLKDRPISRTPLYLSGFIVTAHALAALCALIPGATQLVLSRGDMRHRGLGYVRVTLPGGVALSSLRIHDLRQFCPVSLIHVLSLITLVMLASGIRSARRGDVSRHRPFMQWLLYAALIGAGAFTLMPRRARHHLIFGQ